MNTNWVLIKYIYIFNIYIWKSKHDDSQCYKKIGVSYYYDDNYLEI